MNGYKLMSSAYEDFLFPPSECLLMILVVLPDYRIIACAAAYSSSRGWGVCGKKPWMVKGKNTEYGVSEPLMFCDTVVVGKLSCASQTSSHCSRACALC